MCKSGSIIITSQYFCKNDCPYPDPVLFSTDVVAFSMLASVVRVIAGDASVPEFFGESCSLTKVPSFATGTNPQSFRATPLQQPRDGRDEAAPAAG